MNEYSSDLVLDLLCQLRAEHEGQHEKLSEIITRLGKLERDIAGLHRDIARLHVDLASLAVRIDTLDRRIEKIEQNGL
jgi:septal ring factor EnvC (AmiA/AmiB activator)